jgi:hypothetical protein
MSAETPRNSFRAAVLRGEKPELVLNDKAPQRDPSFDGVDGRLVKRAEARRSDHRGKDRHRLSGETAAIRYRGKESNAELSLNSATVRSSKVRFVGSKTIAWASNSLMKR